MLTVRDASSLKPSLLAVALLCAGLNACTWVKVDDKGLRVQAIQAGTPPPANCQNKGQVEVSVLHEISFYKRDEQKIAEELEKLARNEAGRMEANVIQPESAPAEGRQRFNVYACP